MTRATWMTLMRIALTLRGSMGNILIKAHLAAVGLPRRKPRLAATAEHAHSPFPFFHVRRKAADVERRVEIQSVRW